MSIMTAIVKDPNVYLKTISNHETLSVTITKKDITFSVPSSSILRINTLSGDLEEALEKILYSIIDDQQIQDVSPDNIMKVLEKTEHYYIYSARVHLLPDDIRSCLAVKVSAQTMQKVMKMIRHPWLEFINYFSIQISLYNLKRKRVVKTEADLKLERILRRISLFTFTFDKRSIIDISSYSMNLILAMKDERLYSVSKLLTIIIISYQEYQAKTRSCRGIRQFSNNMQLKEEVKENEQAAHLRMRKYVDYSSRLPQRDLNSLEMLSKQAADVLAASRNKMAFKKKEFEEYANSGNSFNYVDTAGNKKHFIRRKMLMDDAENKEKSSEELIQVKSFNNEDVKVSKASEYTWRDSGEFLHLLNYDKSSIMMSKEKFVNLISMWKSKSQMEVIFNEINGKSIKVSLYKLKIPDSSEELDELKSKLRSSINSSEGTLVEVKSGQMISYATYERILSSYSEDFCVTNWLDEKKKKVTISKKTLKGFLLKEEVCFVKVKDLGNKQDAISSKAALLDAVNQARQLEGDIEVIDYYSGKRCLFKLKEIQIVSLIQEIEDLNQVELKQLKTQRSSIALDTIVSKEIIRPEGVDEVSIKEEEEVEVEHEFTMDSIEQLRIDTFQKPQKQKAQTPASTTISSETGTVIRTRLIRRTRINK